MRGPLGDRAAVEDMLRYAQSARRHATSKDELSDERTLHALLWELAIIGEAANRTSPELRSRHPEVAWARIISFRDILVHAYDKIDLDLVWEAVASIPTLQELLPAIRDELPEL